MFKLNRKFSYVTCWNVSFCIYKGIPVLPLKLKDIKIISCRLKFTLTRNPDMFLFIFMWVYTSTYSYRICHYVLQDWLGIWKYTFLCFAKFRWCKNVMYCLLSPGQEISENYCNLMFW